LRMRRKQIFLVLPQFLNFFYRHKSPSKSNSYGIIIIQNTFQSQ
jgi:hypothetical protein